MKRPVDGRSDFFIVRFKRGKSVWERLTLQATFKSFRLGHVVPRVPQGSFLPLTIFDETHARILSDSLIQAEPNLPVLVVIRQYQRLIHEVSYQLECIERRLVANS